MSATMNVVTISALVEELRSDDITSRLNAVRRISTIALAIGAERTRAELLPFLADTAQDDADEILCVMAEELQHFIPFVGGAPYAYTIIAPLAVLAKADSQMVRDRAVESLLSVAEQLSEEHFTAHFMPLIDSLAESEWYTHRVSACGLYSVAMKRAQPKQKPGIINRIKAHADDELPMVRRAAALCIAKVAPFVGGGEASKDLLLVLLKQLAADEQESVRLHAVPLSAVFIQADIAPAATEPVMSALAQDISWRVRSVFIDHLPQWATALEQPDAAVDHCVALLTDPEPEVRAKAMSAVPQFAAVLPPATVEARIVPALGAVTKDPVLAVRLAGSIAICELASIVPEKAMTQLESMISGFLADETPDVRLSTVSALPTLFKTPAAARIAAKLVVSIINLSEDTAWRVRRAVIDIIPLIVERSGPSFMTEQMSAAVLSWLSDAVFSIRDSAARTIADMLPHLDSSWAQAVLLPKLASLATHPNYLYRVSVLIAIRAIAPNVEETLLATSILPIVIRMATDGTPNVRFNAAQTLGKVGQLVEGKSRDGEIVPVLTGMADDGDLDVRQFAETALEQVLV
ncbi:HEAT repeat protein [Carpediemonas membranifera]|uniref:HEAT repeat protein n=1 Tax=Carpediemonas membranifera TaxID=201153 RepID=A0A8J6E7L2_9EUKA|nr:HEAT repeat protein [Carpediemonas membranifera]|eukprot:KAG9390835.1 HEAT repeat protein [Carpediemonas membranifera]